MIKKLPTISEVDLEPNSSIELPKRRRRRYERRNSKVGKMFFEASSSLAMMTAELQLVLLPLTDEDSNDDEDVTTPSTSQSISTAMLDLTTTTTATPLSDVRTSKVRQRIENPSSIGSKNGTAFIVPNHSIVYTERIRNKQCHPSSILLKRKTYGGFSDHAESIVVNTRRCL